MMIQLSDEELEAYREAVQSYESQIPETNGAPRKILLALAGSEDQQAVELSQRLHLSPNSFWAAINALAGVGLISASSVTGQGIVLSLTSSGATQTERWLHDGATGG